MSLCEYLFYVAYKIRLFSFPSTVWCLKGVSALTCIASPCAFAGNLQIEIVSERTGQATNHTACCFPAVVLKLLFPSQVCPWIRPCYFPLATFEWGELVVCTETLGNRYFAKPWACEHIKYIFSTCAPTHCKSIFSVNNSLMLVWGLLLQMLHVWLWFALKNSSKLPGWYKSWNCITFESCLFLSLVFK